MPMRFLAIRPTASQRRLVGPEDGGVMLCESRSAAVEPIAHDHGEAPHHPGDEQADAEGKCLRTSGVPWPSPTPSQNLCMPDPRVGGEWLDRTRGEAGVQVRRIPRGA